MDIVLDLPDLDASLNWFFAPSHQRTMRRRGLHIKRIDIARKQIVIGGEDEDVEAVVDEIEAERAR